jgi:hypothetical protein
MTVRKKGADAGTLNTRMGFLILDQAVSWHGRIRGAISNSSPFVMRGPDPPIHLENVLFGKGAWIAGSTRQ